MAVCGNRALQYAYSIIWTLRLGCGLNGCLSDGIRHSISMLSLARCVWAIAWRPYSVSPCGCFLCVHLCNMRVGVGMCHFL